jgi:hypothetical protein
MIIPLGQVNESLRFVSSKKKPRHIPGSQGKTHTKKKRSQLPRNMAESAILMRGHLIGCQNSIFCEPLGRLSLKCPCRCPVIGVRGTTVLHDEYCCKGTKTYFIPFSGIHVVVDHGCVVCCICEDSMGIMSL